jgi:hypothetical protein
MEAITKQFELIPKLDKFESLYFMNGNVQKPTHFENICRFYAKTTA